MEAKDKEKKGASVQAKKVYDFDLGISLETKEGVPYRGEYIVTPKISPLILNTKGRNLSKDVTVEAIPCIEAPNEYGTTLTIGGSE